MFEIFRLPSFSCSESMNSTSSEVSYTV